ncbi:MAG: hypothetical protein KC910_09150 [Candidatus Eremiobacteraeota bacterium]|nr:hypothetical protein [Candidatus Eremiobacteraeota bacterium]
MNEPETQSTIQAPLCLVVGIDFNDEGDFARVIYGDPQDQLFVLGWRGFRDLDHFERYWKDHIDGGWSVLVAIPCWAQDSIGIVSWLEARNVTVYRTSFTGHQREDLDLWRLPGTYAGALDLCQSMAYRYNAPVLLGDYWSEMLSLCHAMQKVSENLGILVTGLTASVPGEPTLRPCPF